MSLEGGTKPLRSKKNKYVSSGQKSKTAAPNLRRVQMGVDMSPEHYEPPRPNEKSMVIQRLLAD